MKFLERAQASVPPVNKINEARMADLRPNMSERDAIRGWELADASRNDELQF